MGARHANRAWLSLESFEDRVVPAVTGNVWCDLNADGVKGTGEWGAEGGIPVSLYQGGVWVASTTTNSSGNYSFSQAATSADTVEVSPYYVHTPYTFSTPVDGSGRGVVTAGVGNVGLVGHGWELGGAGTIIVNAWLDADADGVRDGGRPPTTAPRSSCTTAARSWVPTTSSTGSPSSGPCPSGTGVTRCGSRRATRSRRP